MRFRDAPRHGGIVAAGLLLALCLTEAAQAQKTEGTAAPAAAKSTAASVEIAFWNSIQASQDPADFRDYLGQFPRGSFAGLARRRLAALEKPAAPPPAQANPPALANPAQSDTATIEIAYWQSIASSQDAADFQSYLARYPSGSFVPLAANRLAALQKPAPAQQDSEEGGIPFRCPGAGTTLTRSDGRVLKSLATAAEGSNLACAFLDEEFTQIWPLRDGTSVTYRHKVLAASTANDFFPTDTLTVTKVRKVKVAAGEFPALLIELRREGLYSHGQTSTSRALTISRYWYAPALNLTVKHEYENVSGSMYGLQGDDTLAWEAVSITPGPALVKQAAP